MRILHLVSYPLYSGPVPSVLALAQAQRAAGHTVAVAVDAKRGNFNGYEEAALPHLQGQALDPARPLVLSNRSSLAELWRDWRNLRQMRHNLDVVHTHFSHDHALLAALPRGGVARVRTVHAARSLTPRWGQRFLNRRMDGWIVRCAQHADTLRFAFGVAALRIALLPGSLDVAQFAAPPGSRAAVRRRLNIPQDVPVLGHVALMAGRGQEELLEAAANLGARGPHLLLVGLGEREASLRILAQRLRMAERVHFAGYVSGADLRDVYAAMDGAFLAQVGNDASGRAGLEAMAAGLPLLAVQEAALGEMIDSTRGFPLVGRSVHSVTEGLVRWLDAPDFGRAVGLLGREYVLRTRRMGEEMAGTVALYTRLLSTPGG